MQDKLNLVRRGGVVKRFHVLHTLRSQNVAEHSYGVAWLVYFLSDEAPSINLLMAALEHDVAECETGDIPAPAKRRLGISAQFESYERDILAAVEMNPFYDKLTDGEKKILKFADTAELVLYCTHELSLGNSAMRVVYDRGMSYLREIRPWTPAMVQLVQYIQLQYEES